MLGFAFADSKSYRIHPTVIVSALNFYSRRAHDSIGADLFACILLGVENESHVELQNCFPVKLLKPSGQEDEEEEEEGESSDDEDEEPNTDRRVRIDTELFERFFKLYRRLYPRHYVMGWIVFRPNGGLVPETDSLLSELTERHVCDRPVIVVMDPIKTSELKAWVSVRHAFESLSGRRIVPVERPVEEAPVAPPKAEEPETPKEGDGESEASAAAEAEPAPKTAAAIAAAAAASQVSKAPETGPSAPAVSGPVSAVSKKKDVTRKESAFLRTFHEVPVRFISTEHEVAALSLVRSGGELNQSHLFARGRAALEELKSMVLKLTVSENAESEKIRRWLFGQIRELGIVEGAVFEGFAMEDKVQRLLALTYLAKVTKALVMGKKKIVPRRFASDREGQYDQRRDRTGRRHGHDGRRQRDQRRDGRRSRRPRRHN